MPPTSEIANPTQPLLSLGQSVLQRLHRLEQAVIRIEGQLDRNSLVGRTLRLRYHDRDERYLWRHRIPVPKVTEGSVPDGPYPRRSHAWKDVGRHVPEAVLAKVWGTTRQRVDAIELQLAIRQSGRTVLKLVAWLVKHREVLRTPNVQAVWEDPPRSARFTWTFAGGRTVKRGNAGAPHAPLPLYGRHAEELVAGVNLDLPFGELAETVQALLEWGAQGEAKLGGIAALLQGERAWLRLYHHSVKDTWYYREIEYPAGTKHLGLEEVEGRAVALRMPAQQLSNTIQGVTLIEQRIVLRRLFKVLGELVDAGTVWPGGTWKVSGVKGTAENSIWQVSVDEQGIRWRVYQQQKSAEKAGVTDEEDAGEIDLEDA